MSDASLLSHEYQTIAEVARVMNAALIDLKRARVHAVGREQGSATALAASGARLAAILHSLSTSIAPRAAAPAEPVASPEAPIPVWAMEVDAAPESATLSPGGGSAAELAQIVLPEAFIARIRAEHGARLGFFLDDLRSVTHTLAAAPTSVSEEQLALLDSISSVADVEASRVFRRFLRG